MFKSKEIPESSQTSNPFATKTTPAGSPCTNELYITPGKRRLLPAPLNNKSNEYQLLVREAGKKTINGILNKVNTSNLPLIVRELFKDHIIRVLDLLAYAIIKAQIASPFYTPVYAALVSIVNTKFPTIGELICKRLISSFHRTHQCNEKSNCIAITKFLAHLLNQNILHRIIALQILLFFLENSTDDGVILTTVFLKACGQKLSQVSSIGLDSVFSKLTNLLHKSSLNKSTKDMIEDLFAIRNDQFKAHPAIISGLDLVDEKDQHTHTLQLDDFFDSETMLDGVFQYDKQYEVNEEKYKQIRKRILDDEDSSSSTSSSSTSSSSTSSSSNSSSSTSSSSTSSSSTSSSSISSSSTSSSSTSSNSKEEDAADEEKKQTIIDQTQTDLATFRRVFQYDKQYEVNEEKYKQIRKRILDDEDSSSSTSSSSTSSSFISSSSTSSSSTSSSSTSSSSTSSSSTSSSSTSSNSKEEDDADEEKQQTIIDQTETYLATFRLTIYLTIPPNIGAEVCAHKLRRMNLCSGEELILCRMIVVSCAEQSAYEHFFGLLGQSLCSLQRQYILNFGEVFHDKYLMVHGIENVKLRNMAKFFAYLLATDSISWGIFKYIQLVKENTTSSLLVYLKNLFVGLFEFLGFTKLKNRLSDPTLTMYFRGLFVCDSPENARFSINFFTSIGLGRVTDELRELIRLNPRPAPPSLMSIYIEIENNFDDHHRRYEENEKQKKNHQCHMV